MALTGETYKAAVLLNNSKAENNFVRITLDAQRRLELFDGQYRTLSDNGRTKQFDAIVAANGTGDYSTVSAALAAGKTNIYLRAGTYIETSQWNITSSVRIIGENVADTIVLFAGLSVPCVFIDGNGGTSESSGTISITNGTNIVTGVGTSFTNLSVGDCIIIGTIPYIISSVISDTSLSLSTTYNGITVSGFSYIATTFIHDVLIQNMTILNNTTSPCTSNGVKFRGVIRAVMINTYVLGFVGNVMYDVCIGALFFESTCSSSTSYGLTISDCFNTLVNNSNMSNNIGDGLVVTGSLLGSNTVILNHMICSNNGGNGASIIDGSLAVNFSDAIISYNGMNGIRTTNGTSNILITSCDVINNNVGVSFLGTNNSVIGSLITNNLGTGVIPGDNCSITTCQINQNGSNGVDLKNDIECNISGCYFNANTGSGIEMTGNSSNNVITGNSFINNTIYGINFGSNTGGESTVSGNVFVDNTTAGIRIQNDNNIISSNRVTGSTTGILIVASANDTIVTSNNTTNSTTGITDNGTGTALANNK